ncbi:uncharacterized protein PV07_08231 [Cladophialophora immunda]|uniref:Uncharacterized protein n=1 Tax=Cladophialophora immunda TaxID=569365 RepID=A0A0D2CBY2_9EURO|nr:uncharacterized protein PV07_08231 [Cladophialophora immunda]KIW28578.1 hypothetical protein PV07_08231 [Cladophialophora immunda]OQU95187.1 hypothetical protein CLAIMM_01431 [Cladophialophora immunda]
MKRLARTLSSRSTGGKSRPHPPSSYGDGTARPNQAHVRKSSLTSPIPPYTQVHFPQCPHTTPPTPRPARLPAVLRTEIVEPERRTDDSGPGRASSNADGDVQVRQFLTAPTHCLDCTLALAAQQESWIRERCDAVVRELKLRLVELKSGLAALGAAEKATVSSSRGSRSEPDDETREGVQQIKKLETEIQCHEERAEEHLRRRDGDVRKLWDQVRRDWEGGVREVVRDDGTGEAEERCVFAMPWDEDVSGVEEQGCGIRQGESRTSVRVRWLPIEED